MRRKDQQSNRRRVVVGEGVDQRIDECVEPALLVGFQLARRTVKADTGPASTTRKI
jgi:hypothetical protein